LLDVNMPGMGGLAACKAIRADSSVAIVMLTVPLAMWLISLIVRWAG
jgi:CheY-like chemotaxis protein